MRRFKPRRLHFHEVCPRDGFQAEPTFIPTRRKIDLIDRLSRTGVAKIEVTSFVSPKAIPQLADAAEVMRGIARVEGVVYAALVPNLKGAEQAIACRVDELNLVMSASRGHGLANLRMTPEQSLEGFRTIVEAVRGSGVALNASISTAFGCPFDGPVAARAVLGLVARCEQLGIGGVTLCDTTGMADPVAVARLLEAARRNFPALQLTAHLHDTRAMGLANALAAFEVGIDRFDASLGGLGGCPFAPGSTGNVCTEDLVHMFERVGCDTGVDLDALLSIARDLPPIVGHEVPGRVMKAGKSDRLYPRPESRT